MPEAEPPAPREALGRLFARFLRFGWLAWGGPVAQVAMIRQELVDEERWTTPERFHRTLAVYQVLPGPEAHELCVHYGMHARGRLGGVLAGLGFMLPGTLLMLLLSALYAAHRLDAPAVAALFLGFQPAVAALVVRAAHRLATGALHEGPLRWVAGGSALATLAGAPFWVVLPAAGFLALLARRGRARLAFAAGVVLVAAAAGIAAQDGGLAGGVDPAAGAEGEPGRDPGLAELFVSGLKAGLLTFGGAYTAIPLVQGDAVGAGGWLTLEEFVDGIALSGVLPAPLIVFTVHVGYLGGGPWGALAMAAGVFLPAFAITLVGFRHLERAIRDERLHTLLDGVAAGVIGLVAVTALALLRLSLGSVAGATLLAVALLLLWNVPGRAAVPLAVLGCGGLGLLAYP